MGSVRVLSVFFLSSVKVEPLPSPTPHLPLPTVIVPVDVTDEMVADLLSFRGEASSVISTGEAGAGVAGAAGAGSSDGHTTGGVTVRYTRYPSAPSPTGWEDYDGHASWKLAYRGPELFAWLLAHRLSAPVARLGKVLPMEETGSAATSAAETVGAVGPLRD